ncbi:response regulator [Chitinophaga alhagiae]|uniref:Response regulator n=2 Tax=Chitinophaga alhagiae TaxID=2203219 RepID=A0ABM6W970_9BACT|nr:response regulator [Chitinophaga alhagiae]
MELYDNIYDMANANKVVYVIDDDEIFHFIVKKMFGLQGWNVVVNSFLSAEDAIEDLSAFAEQNLPCLIILDMNMQRMNGWDFIEAFRGLKNRLRRHVPIIMCSSSMNIQDMEKVKKTPELMAYITKPLDKSKMKVIEEYL